MSVVEYLRILDQCSKEIVWQSEREWLKLIYGRFIPDGSVDDITDVITLLNKLEEKNLLGIDRLKVLKELLKGIRKWDLLRILERFEMKRKEYRQLLEQISHALEESIELQRLILICRRKNLVAHEREEHIKNVNALLAELEQQHELGIEDLGILKTIATEMEKPDLCRLVEEFEKKREQEEDAERERIKWEDNKRRAGGKEQLPIELFSFEIVFELFDQMLVLDIEHRRSNFRILSVTFLIRLQVKVCSTDRPESVESFKISNMLDFIVNTSKKSLSLAQMETKLKSLRHRRSNFRILSVTFLIRLQVKVCSTDRPESVESFKISNMLDFIVNTSKKSLSLAQMETKLKSLSHNEMPMLLFARRMFSCSIFLTFYKGYLLCFKFTECVDVRTFFV